jgi:hypothetical protein
MSAFQRAAVPADSDQHQEMAMPALLRQLAHELGALQLMAADMESSVDDMIERHAGVLDARSIQNLQLLDILNQTLLALATFAGNAASLSPPDWRIDGKAVTAELKLASLAQRLARGGGGAAKPAALPSDQSYELFADG